MAAQAMVDSPRHASRVAPAQLEPPCATHALACCAGTNVDFTVRLPTKEFLMQKLALSAALVSVALLSGCASILNDKTQRINVVSSNGKTFDGTIDGVPFTGPGIVSIPRSSSSKIISVSTAGCTKQTALESNLDIKFLGNVLIPYFGSTGSTIDYSTDKMWKYAENAIVSCN